MLFSKYKSTKNSVANQGRTASPLTAGSRWLVSFHYSTVFISAHPQLTLTHRHTTSHHFLANIRLEIQSAGKSGQHKRMYPLRRKQPSSTGTNSWSSHAMLWVRDSICKIKISCLNGCDVCHCEERTHPTEKLGEIFEASSATWRYWPTKSVQSYYSVAKPIGQD